MLDTIKDICKEQCGSRSESDIKLLKSLTKNIKLFQDMVLKQGENSHAACCQYLLYEEIPSQEYVFKQGDVGNKFYILLSGIVSIEILKLEDGKRTIQEIMTYTAGGSFGELALESSKPRSASAYCKTSCSFLILLKKDYSRLMQKLVFDKKNEMVNFLQDLPAFKNLNKIALSKLTYNIKEKTFTKGQILFKEEDPATEIFIIHDGECKLCKYLKPQSSAGIRKSGRFICHTAKRLGRGAMMGEEDIINKKNHSYTAVCSSDSITCYTIPATEFFMRITADKSLQYLKEVSQEKFLFLES